MKFRRSESIEFTESSLHLGLSPRIWVVMWIISLLILATGTFIIPESFPQILMGLIVGVVAVAFLLARIELSLTLLIFLGSSFIPPGILNISLPSGGSLEIRDIVFISIIGSVILQALGQRKASIPWWPVGGVLLAFLTLSIFSAVYSLLLQSVAVNPALSELRNIMYYGTFFIAAWAVRTRGQLKKLLSGLFIIADLTATFVILQHFFGNRYPLQTGTEGAGWQFSQSGLYITGLGIFRVTPAGLILMFFMMIIAFYVMIASREKPDLRYFSMAQFGYLNFGLIFVLTRVQWLAAAAAIFLALMVILLKSRRSFLQISMFCFMIFVLIFCFLTPDLQELSADVPLANSIVERTASLIYGDATMESASKQWRILETGDALNSIRKNPALGVGLGNTSRQATTLLGQNPGWTNQEQGIIDLDRMTGIVHNSFLMIAVQMGLPGILLFLWFCGAFLVGSWRIFNQISDPVDGSIILAIASAFIGLLFWSISQPYLMEAGSIAVIGLMVGWVASINYVQNPLQMSSHARLTSLTSINLRPSLPSFAKASQPVRRSSSIPKAVQAAFSRNFIYTVLGSGASVVLLFLETIIAARILDPGSFGVYVLLLTVVNFFVIVIDFGCKTSVTQLIASSDRKRQGELVSNTILFRLLVAALLSGLLWIGRGFLGLLDPTRALVELARFLPWMIVLPSLDELTFGILQGFQSYRQTAITQIVRNFLRLTLSIVFLMVHKMGIMALVYSWIISFGISSLYQYLVMPIPKRLSLKRTLLSDVFKFGLPLQLNRTLWFTSSRIHVLMLGMLSGPVSVAFFSVAERIPAALKRLSDSFITVYFPTITAMAADGKRNQAINLLNGSLRLISFLSATVALFCVLFSKEIITLLFSTKYVDSAPTFGLLMLALQMGMLVNIMGYTLTALGHPELPMIESFSRTAISVLGNILLIPPLGFIGSAIATFISNHASNPLALWFLKRSNILPKITPYLTQSILLLLSAGFYWWIQPELIMEKVAIIFTFLLVNLLLATVSRDDLRLIVPGFRTRARSIIEA